MTVTISEVARQAQVSASTVSRVFTMPELVREPTRRRVWDVATELGYRPNRAARGLVSGKTGNVGIIVPDLANPLFPSVVKGAQARARETDHAVFLADTDEDPREEFDLIQTMAKQVDGVIVCSSRLSRAQIEEVADLTSLVLLNRQVPHIPSVLMDSADGMRQAVDHLAALGHQRVAYLQGPRSSWSNGVRRRGLRSASQRHGLEVTTLGPFAPYFEAGVQAADLALASQVTAILAYNDLLALGVLARLADRGVAIPDEVSVTGFDDIAMAGMATPPLTTVALPAEQAGRVAVDMLHAILGNRGSQPDESSRRRLSTQLIVRSSTTPPAKLRERTPGDSPGEEPGEPLGKDGS